MVTGNVAGQCGENIVNCQAGPNWVRRGHMYVVHISLTSFKKNSGDKARDGLRFGGSWATATDRAVRPKAKISQFEGLTGA